MSGGDEQATDIRGFSQQPPPPRATAERPLPRLTRRQLAGGASVLSSDLPGRALISARVVLPAGGAGLESSERAGITSLTARALSEGTAEHSADELTQEVEQLGARIEANVDWENLNLSIDAPAWNFEQALTLAGEMLREPRFAAEDIERLRAEQQNDLLQGQGDPGQRADWVFNQTIYAGDSPLGRPIDGTGETVKRLGREDVLQRHQQMLSGVPSLLVAGDLGGTPIERLADQYLSLSSSNGADGHADFSALPTPDGPRIVLVHLPGAPQSQIRVGHVGISRRIPDYHAVAVMTALLGGLANSRLQRLLRDQLGYTYGVRAAFDMRRVAGPFVVRTAVQSDVTVESVGHILHQLGLITSEPVEASELEAARSNLIGGLPFRFRTPRDIVGTMLEIERAGLADDEFDQYRAKIAAVSADDVLHAAQQHIHPDQASIVIAGDADQLEGALENANLGRPIVRSK